MIIKNNYKDLEALSNVLSKEMTGSEITKAFELTGFTDISNSSEQFGYSYKIGDNKQNRIFKNFVNEYNKSGSDLKIIKFIEYVVSPSKYVDNKKKFDELVDSLNKVLLFMGCDIENDGKIHIARKAKTIDDVLNRVDTLKSELKKRNIHFQILKYCSKEYLANDYFHACFEAVKGVYDRLREMTQITNFDGIELINFIFNVEFPKIVINSHNTKSDINEFNGFKNLIISLTQLVRNPDAHIARIKKETELDECLDILTIVSYVHKRLDIANVTCCAKQ